MKTNNSGMSYTRTIPEVPAGVNLASWVDENAEYAVSYTVGSDGQRSMAPSAVMGRDLTHKQIVELFHRGALKRPRKQSLVSPLLASMLGFTSEEDSSSLYAFLLSEKLHTILAAGDNYPLRNSRIISAVNLAQRAGYPAGFRVAPEDPRWVEALIELPTGQVSWLLPQHVHVWDGHTPEQRTERINAFLATK